MNNFNLTCKVAKAITGATYTKSIDIITNYKLVPSDYNFVVNNDEDVTSFMNLQAFFSFARISYKVFRDSLSANVLPSWTGLTTTDKENLAYNRIYPSGFTQIDIENLIGVDGYEYIQRVISEYEFTDDIYVEYTGFTGNTNNKIDFLSGVTDTKLDSVTFTGYTGNTNIDLNNKLDISGGTINGSLNVTDDTYIGDKNIDGSYKIYNQTTGTTETLRIAERVNGNFEDILEIIDDLGSSNKTQALKICAVPNGFIDKFIQMKLDNLNDVGQLYTTAFQMEFWSDSVSRAKFNTSGNFEMLNNNYVITPQITPSSDSTTAIKITKADGITSLLSFDTTNNKIIVPSGYSPTENIHLTNKEYVDDQLNSKIDKITTGTTANIPIIKSNGNLEDSGYAISDLTGGTGSVNWGDIGGILNNQTDLQNALNNKLDDDIFTGYTASTVGVTASRKFFAGKSSNQNLIGSQSPVTNWDGAATYSDSEVYTWDNLTGELTFLKAGIYEISFDLVVFDTGGSSRSQARSYLQEDTGSGFTDIPYTRKEYYNRQNNYGASGSVNITREFNIGDKIRPTAWQTEGSDTLTIVGDSTSLAVIKSEVGINTTKYILTGSSALTLNYIERVSGATGNLGQFTTDGNLEDTGTTVDELIASKGATNAFYAYSKTAANGLQDEGFNLNVTRVTTGVYDYTFIEPASDTSYGVFAQPFGTTTDTNSQISNVTTTGFRVEMGQGDNGNTPDVLVDTDHAVGVFGVPVSGFSGVSVVSYKTFTGYTASTDTRLDGIETDVGNNTSDITDLQNDKLDITEFNSYTGTTDTLIETKLDETIFNIFTGTTLPANYYNKTEINNYTGTTETLIGTKLNTSDFNSYSAATQIEIDSKIPKIGPVTADNIVLTNADGTVYDSGISIDNITGGTGFYYYVDKQTSQSTTSTSNVVYLTGTATGLQAGTWSVDFNAVGGNTGKNKAIYVSFYIDGVIQGVEQNKEASSGTERTAYTISKDLVLTAGSHTFEIRFRSGNGTSVLDYGAIRAKLVN